MFPTSLEKIEPVLKLKKTSLVLFAIIIIWKAIFYKTTLSFEKQCTKKLAAILGTFAPMTEANKKTI